VTKRTRTFDARQLVHASHSMGQLPEILFVL